MNEIEIRPIKPGEIHKCYTKYVAGMHTFTVSWKHGLFYKGCVIEVSDLEVDINDPFLIKRMQHIDIIEDELLRLIM